MSDAFVNGFGGSIEFVSASMDVDTWTLNANGEAVDTTNTGGAGWEANILGAKSWEGSIKSFFDTSAVPTGAAGYVNGARGILTLSVGGTGKTYTGTVQLTQVSIENPAKSVITFSANFKGSGALTYAS